MSLLISPKLINLLMQRLNTIVNREITIVESAIITNTYDDIAVIK
jgi:hypothetical protein